MQSGAAHFMAYASRFCPGRHGQPEENEDCLIEPQDVLVIRAADM
jgi:hypothetical protein